jgi:hypothetical protein
MAMSHLLAEDLLLVTRGMQGASFSSGFLSTGSVQTLNRKFTTSPSCMT